MAPTETKRSKKVTALTWLIVLFAVVQFYMITYRQNDLWMAWWLGIPMVVYFVMVPLIALRVFIAFKHIGSGFAVGLRHGLMILVCAYALWTVYASYTVFA